MNEISIFLANNYVWFIVVDVLLVFALIGYFIDAKNKKTVDEKTEIHDTIKYEEPIDNIEELTMQMGDKANKSLNSVVNSIETLETPTQEEAPTQEETETLK